MSKYKYTGLLSSQYRSVFKSYHSVEKYERQTDYKPSFSQNKRQELTSFKSVENKRNMMVTRENLKTISHDDQYRSSECKAQTNNRKTKFYTQSDDRQSFAQNQQFATNTNHEKLLNQIKNKYQFDSNHNFSRKSNLSNESKRNIEPKSTKKFEYNTITYDRNVNEFQNVTLDEMPCKRPQVDFHTISHANNSFKTKVSQVNKRRDDIKLKMRVNNIDQINRRYDYIDVQNTQQKNYKHNNQQVHPSKYHQRESLINPLQEISLNHLNLKLERRILENITNKGTQKFLTKYNEEQNIKTPHFHTDETKIKEIDAAIVQNKLKNFSKKINTDRY